MALVFSQNPNTNRIFFTPSPRGASLFCSAGFMNSARLRELLQSRPLQIEVHDRDVAARDAADAALRPALFGHASDDDAIADVRANPGKRTRVKVLQGLRFDEA